MNQIEQIKRELEELTSWPWETIVGNSSRLAKPIRRLAMLVEYVEAAEAQRRSSKFEGYELVRARFESARRKLGLE